MNRPFLPDLKFWGKTGEDSTTRHRWNTVSLNDRRGSTVIVSFPAMAQPAIYTLFVRKFIPPAMG
ncbi:hypothetical protein [Bacteroides fragilis]|uniref:hypothetical protein n=1 Tax=Bacteroides fragilis TaxID=817 RepID=UPI0015F41CE2|nr:hypothetical protein [Bacteroides fragilis]